MIAADTNVIVRVLTNDDPAQTRRARALLLSNRVWVSKTVLLETVWVLRHSYNFDDDAISQGITTLDGVETIELEDRDVVFKALTWCIFGMAFDDALHLASSATANEFATFDRKLANVAAKANATPPVRRL